MSLRIRGGRVFDPGNGVDGEIRDIRIVDGRITDDPTARDREPERVIDASDRIVMAGAIDMHSHIAGPAVNRARRLSHATRIEELAPDDHGVRSVPIVPSTHETGGRYASLGYSLAIDAAISPTGSRQCLHELSRTPNIDGGFLLLLANHRYLIELLARGERELAIDTVRWLLARTGALGIKAVNAGGVEHWKSCAGSIESIEQSIPGLGVSPLAILELLADAAGSADLPHPLHIHCNHLGKIGNVETTLATSRALAGRRHHLAHVQFHAYGDESGWSSAAHRITEHLARNPDVTADVGQVVFGDAVTISGDEEIEHFLWKLTGNPHVNVDTELESGCGIVPLSYRMRSMLHALQWAVGLELFLLVDDPWSLALTSDHPNGASFLTYPKIVAWLMSRDARAETITRVAPEIASRTSLAELSREYSLFEIAIVTRAAPARMLGLRDRGHLGPGARGDVVVYEDRSDRERMFRWPAYVIRDGRVIVERGEILEERAPRQLRADVRDATPTGSDAERAFGRWWREHGSYDLGQLGPGADALASCELVSRREIDPRRGGSR